METSLGKKPYKFIPINSSCKKEQIVYHNGVNCENTYSGKFKIVIKTITSVHIGQGKGGFDLNNGRVIKKFMRRNDKIVIPGSSIKGMIRSIFEAVTESCSPRLPNDFKPLKNALPGENQVVCIGKNKDTRLCPTCSVFGTVEGSSGYKGKLRISEFELCSNEKNNTEIVNIPNLKSPFKNYPENNDLNIFNKNPENNKNNKKEYGNERLYYADFYKDEEKYNSLTKEQYYKKVKELGSKRTIKFRGRKFYLHNFKEQEILKNYNGISYEMVSKNSEFKGSINFENLTENELAALGLTLGIGENYKYKIGYGKPAYFGSIELKVDEINDYNERYTNKKSFDIDKLINIKDNYKSSVPDDLKLSIDKLEQILTGKLSGEKWPEIKGNKVY